MKKLVYLSVRLIALAVLLPQTTLWASELVYVPTNPSFGGRALNGSVLLAKARAQNKFTDPDVTKRVTRTPLQEFNRRLQNSILSRFTATISSGLIDADGNPVPGVFETSEFLIEVVVNNDETLTVTTTDKSGGDSTTFTLGQKI